MKTKPNTSDKQASRSALRGTDCSLSFLSDEECESIIVVACTVRPHTEDELAALIRWAETARMDNMLVNMILEKKMRVEWTSEGEPQFDSVNTELYGNPHNKPLVAAIEIQRNEWKTIAAEALASFRCTQRPEIYPEGHWSRRAQSLLANATCMSTNGD